MENFIAERIEMIDALRMIANSDRLGRPTGLLSHAILNTFSLKFLIDYYINEEPQNLIISRNIIKRLPEDAHRIVLYESIFERLKQASYVNRLRLRKFIDVLIKESDETKQAEYFSYFIHSSYKLEISAALQNGHFVWDDGMKELLITRYNETGNIEILLALIKFLEKAEVLILAKKMWESGMQNYLKVRFIQRIKGWKLKDLGFVRDTDPGNYLVLINFSGEKVPDEVIIDCYERTPDPYKPFAIWNIGRLGKWHLIKKPIQSFINDPDNVFDGFFETIYD